jgi:hypothetical protein
VIPPEAFEDEELTLLRAGALGVDPAKQSGAATDAVGRA